MVACRYIRQFRVRMKRQIKVVLIILLIVLWGLVSWRWYTCGVKGFCGDEAFVEEDTTEMQEDIEVDDTRE